MITNNLICWFDESIGCVITNNLVYWFDESMILIPDSVPWADSMLNALEGPGKRQLSSWLLVLTRGTHNGYR